MLFGTLSHSLGSCLFGGIFRSTESPTFSSGFRCIFPSKVDDLVEHLVSVFREVGLDWLSDVERFGLLKPRGHLVKHLGWIVSLRPKDVLASWHFLKTFWDQTTLQNNLRAYHGLSQKNFWQGVNHFVEELDSKLQPLDSLKKARGYRWKPQYPGEHAKRLEQDYYGLPPKKAP